MYLYQASSTYSTNSVELVCKMSRILLLIWTYTLTDKERLCMAILYIVALCTQIKKRITDSIVVIKQKKTMVNKIKNQILLESETNITQFVSVLKTY